LEKAGVDLLVVETMMSLAEARAALIAAKEVSELPVMVTMTFESDGRTLFGTDARTAAVVLESLGAIAIGVNCSTGPAKMQGIINEMASVTEIPIIAKPNAGLPALDELGNTIYNMEPSEFAEEMKLLIDAGATILGGCCGTSPAYIKALSNTFGIHTDKKVSRKPAGMRYLTSERMTLSFGLQDKFIIVGERINPTGKKRFKQALAEHDIDYILQEGIRQQELGAHVLDVNVGLPEIDEAAMLCEATRELQAVIDLPLQLDTANPTAMERALRLYNGKALVNSVNGKPESMHAIFPAVQKYGGVVIALTLDDSGIPADARGRVQIAKKILEVAASYGISKEDIIFDPLAMTVSADQGAASVTLQAVRMIRRELGCHTSLGVSNVSFGLPMRDAVNSVFFAAALENGLSAAIMNPDSIDMRKVYYAYRVLHGMDENCAAYIDFASTCPQQTVIGSDASRGNATVREEGGSTLQKAILNGRASSAAAQTSLLLQTTEPLEIVQREIIPALDRVGKGFEEKTVYLPQLLMSAEAAKAAFEEIKRRMSSQASTADKKMTVVLATVKGDIHDIGKNIVKLLLENYGFSVIDLGKDVPPDSVVQTVLESGAPLVGLSALMTTTVPAMAETIAALRVSAPNCRVMVGGAVMNEAYSKEIGADCYCKDAMEAVRYAETI